MGAGVFGFFGEVDDLAQGIEFSDPESGGVIGSGGEGYGEVGVVFLVEVDERFIAHAVGVVAGDDEHVFGVATFDEVEVLEEGIGGAAVPVGGFGAHVGREEAELAVGADEVPGDATGDVIHEGGGAVLGEDTDAADSGIGEVGEGEVDRAVAAAHDDGGFGSFFGEGGEFADATSGEDHGDSFIHGARGGND